MFNRTPIIIVLGILLGLPATGCQNKKPVQQIESSASLPGYAEGFPSGLSAEMTRYTEDATRTRDTIGTLGSYPDGLNDPDWGVVAEVYQDADADGRGYGYAARAEETRIVGRFFEEEKEGITRRVNGAVKNAAEKAECQCELDTYGKVSYALKDAVERSIEERAKATSEAYAVIEKNEKSLGSKNAEVLEDQAAAISFAAYVVFVEMPTLYNEVARRLDEVKTVKATLEEEISAETARREAPETSRSEKKKIDEHLKALENARSAVDIFQAEAEQLVKKAETEIPEIRKAYDDAFDALMKEVEKRRKASPAEGGTN
jgi:uncharacterized protein YoxC